MDLKEYQAAYHEKKKLDPAYVAKRKAQRNAWYARNKTNPEFIAKMRTKNKVSRLKFRDVRNQECKDWYHAHKNDEGFKAKRAVFAKQWLQKQLADPEFKQAASERHRKFLKQYESKHKQSYAKTWYDQHKNDVGFKEKRKLWQKQNRAQNKERYALKSKKEKLRSYGLTLTGYDRLLLEQNYICGLCFKPETARDKHTNKVKALSIDHNHATGKIRRLLCTKCNMGLGSFNENPELLLAAIRYLEEHKEKTI